MKTILVAISLVFVGCASMKTTRLPENKIALNLSVGYQDAYRLISQSLVNDCGVSAHGVHNVIYTDIGTATITNEAEDVVTWTMDLKKQTDTSSIMDFYTTFGAQKKFATRIADHINNNIAGCVFDEVKAAQS